MAEIGINISHQQSKTLLHIKDKFFDMVITVCDEANARCPVFSNAVERIHWSIKDPTLVQGTPEQQLEAFWNTRKDLQKRIETELLRLN